MENNPVFVLLAGGKSERMGVDKGLLKYKNTFWILEQLHRVSQTTIDEVYIGLGHNFQHYYKAIPWLKEATSDFVKFNHLKVKVIVNKHPELGAFSTLQTVLQHIHKTVEVIAHPIDIPILNATELQTIISTKNTIVFPNFEGKNGHPIKMESSFWTELMTLDLSNDAARLDFQLKKINPVNISKIEVSDENILYNLNTTSQWKSYLKEVE
jgi:CTP:molybdopterin cytidylyltransferase MocA